MSSSKQTKRALFSSFWALLLCFAMLLGTTFAWFTDTASTGVNKIQAGNLDMEVYHQLNDGSWELIDGKTNLFDNVNGDSILWEPGATATETFKIKNVGNLAFKYLFKLNYTNATKTTAGKTLADVLTCGLDDFVSSEPITSLQDIEFEYYLLPNTEMTLPVRIKWEPTDHDNDYNVKGGLSIDLGINVYATQYTYESDSTGNQYDADAAYRSLISTGSKRVGTTYNGADVDKQLTATDIKHTFKDGVSDGMAVYLTNGAKLTLDDVTLSATTENDTGKRNIGFFVYNGASLTINSGTYSINGEYGCMIWVQQGATGQSTVTINGGSFTSNCKTGGMINAYDGTKVTITGGFFDQSAGNPNVTLQCKNNDQITVTGGTFVNYNPTGHCTIPTGYHVTSAAQADGTTWYTVVAD